MSDHSVPYVLVPVLPVRRRFCFFTGGNEATSWLKRHSHMGGMLKHDSEDPIRL